MRIALIFAGLMLVLPACAMLQGSQKTPSERHEVTLPQEGTSIKKGIKVAQGPMTLLQATYMPNKGPGSAFIWVSEDASCPEGGPATTSKVLPSSAWYGPQTLGPNEYLCASQVDNETAATLTWYTSGSASSGSASPQ